VSCQDTSAVVDTAPPTEFVYQQGGVAGDRTYTDWAAMMADVDATPGSKIIVFDPTFEMPRIPAGTWDMTDTWWTDVFHDPITQKQLYISDGVFLPELGKIDFVYGANSWAIVNESVSGPVVTYSGDGFFEFNRTGEVAAQILQDAGELTSPFISITGFGLIILGAFASFGGNSATPGGAATSPSPILDIAFGFCIWLSPGGSLSKNALGGSGTISLRLTQNPNEGSNGIEDQPNHTGVIQSPRVLVAPRLNIVGLYETIDLPWGSHAAVDTSNGAGTVNLRASRHRQGDTVEVKDTLGNAGNFNITVNAYKAEMAASLEYAENAGGDSTILGALPDGLNPGDEITVAGTASNNGTYSIKSLIDTGVAATSGVELSGAVLTDEAAVASTATYQELIDGSPLVVLVAAYASLKLRVYGNGKISAV
jgi:hypothetical protein